MAPHSSNLAWKIPWTEEPGRLQSMGSRRVGHDSSDLAAVQSLEKNRSSVTRRGEGRHTICSLKCCTM